MHLGSSIVREKKSKKSLSYDGTNELIQFLKEDSEKQTKRDNMFLNLMSQVVQSHSIHSAVLSVLSCYPSPYPTQVPKTPLPSEQKLLTTNPASNYNCSQSQQFSFSCSQSQ